MHIFRDKVVVVTGGNDGIGKSIAKKFADAGAKIALFARDKTKLEQAQRELSADVIVAGDVSHIADLDKLFNKTHAQLGKIDVLIANAGIASRRSVEEVDENYFDEMVNINFKGAYFTVQRSLPYLNDHASIVLVSSMATQQGWPSHSVYSASKAAVSMLAKNFSADLIARGIRVNALSPGFTATKMFEQDFIDSFQHNIPTGKFVSPEEIADAAFFISSPNAKSIVGIDFIIDGGMSSIVRE